MASAFENGGPIGMAVRSALMEAILPYCPTPENPPRERPEAGRSKREQGHRKGQGQRVSNRPETRLNHDAGAIGKGQRGPEGLEVEQWHQIGRQIMSLHEGYTRRGVEFSQAKNPIHGALAGYQLYYTPRNLYRVHHVLSQLPWRSLPGATLLAPWVEARASRGSLRVLDLGSGAGAFSLAWLVWMAERFPGGHGAPKVELTLVDQGRELLTLAEANLKGLVKRVLPGLTMSIETRADGVSRFLAEHGSTRPFAVVGAAMTLNEMDLLGPRRVSVRAQGLADGLARQVLDGGLVVLVEPGTRKGYMNLMTVREHLIDWPILHPCPHNDHCPFYDGTVRNWCHATIPLPKGFFFDDVLKKLGVVEFDMRYLNTAGLAFQAMDEGVLQPFQAAPGRRIVSEALRPRKKGRGNPPSKHSGAVMLACQPEGRVSEIPAEGHHYPARGKWLDARKRNPRP